MVTRYETLARHYGEAIARGDLKPGERLPSIRLIAAERGLSASTVVEAMRLLERQGLVEARPQSGFYARHRPERRLPPERTARREAPVPVGLTRQLMQVLTANAGLPFATASLAPELIDGKSLARLAARVARKNPALMNAPDRGTAEPSLLHALGRWSLGWGAALNPEEIVVTHACTEALALCLAALTRPGDTVAIETPGYYLTLQLLESMGLQALEIPSHPESGVSCAALQNAIGNRRVAACLLIANGGNPLGAVVPDAEKARIATWLNARAIPLIEDDVYGDICFTSARPRPIHAFDSSGNTLLCTSFSKTISPALRVGIVAAGRHAAAIRLQKTLASGRTSPLLQSVLAEALETPGFAARLRRLRRQLAEQVGRTREAVLRYFPAETRVSDPGGGFVLWVELPPHLDTLALHPQAVAEGIGYVPGCMFSARGEYGHFLRLACGEPFTTAHEAALARLGALLRRARPCPSPQCRQ